MNKQYGLTMVEVLVALVITAIALIAATKAMRTLIDGADRQETVVFAQLCANNDLTMVRISQQYPTLGDAKSTCIQNGVAFEVTRNVTSTANPSFRRVQSIVFKDGKRILSVATVIGRY